MRPGRLRESLGTAAQPPHATAFLRPVSSAFVDEHVTPAQAQPLRPFELPHFGERVDHRVRVRADAEASPGLQIRSAGNDAVAEVGLGRWCEAGDGAARGESRDLAIGHVRRMDDAPSVVDVRLRQQPLDRPHAAPCVAFVDFARLLGGVDVDRRIGRGESHDLAELFRRDGSQAVRRDADM